MHMMVKHRSDASMVVQRGTQTEAQYFNYIGDMHQIAHHHYPPKVQQ